MENLPWLNTSPRDYLAAAEAGTRAGLSIAGQRQQQSDRAAAMGLQDTEHQRREKDVADALEQRRIEESNRMALALWEQQQRQQMAAAALASHERQNAGALALRQAYEMERIDAQNRAIAAREAAMNQPELRTVKGQGLVSIDPRTGRPTVVMPEFIKPDEPFTPGETKDIGGGLRIVALGPKHWQLLQPEGPTKAPQVTVLLDPADSTKGKITGPVDHPMIKQRLDAAKPKPVEPAPDSGWSLFKPGSWFGSSKPTMPERPSHDEEDYTATEDADPLKLFTK